MAVIIQDEDFSADALLEENFRGDGTYGALVCFFGHVRQDADGALVSMTLEHFPEMAIASLEKLETETRARFDVDNVLILHRFGTMCPGEKIMMVATSSAHRKEAFHAADFLMDFLKTDAPFWKKETRTTDSRWVASNPADELLRAERAL